MCSGTDAPMLVARPCDVYMHSCCMLLHKAALFVTFLLALPSGPWNVLCIRLDQSWDSSTLGSQVMCSITWTLRQLSHCKLYSKSGRVGASKTLALVTERASRQLCGKSSQGSRLWGGGGGRAAKKRCFRLLCVQHDFKISQDVTQEAAMKDLWKTTFHVALRHAYV